MWLYKFLAVVLITYGISITAALAQSAIGRTTRLMHPSGIPASVTTDNDGTVANVDGRIVSESNKTELSAHEAAVKELQWSGFQLQEPDPQNGQ